MASLSDLWDLFEMARRGTVWSVGSADLSFNPFALEDLGEFRCRRSPTPRPRPPRRLLSSGLLRAHLTG
jgi:hypothetical protein